MRKNRKEVVRMTNVKSIIELLWENENKSGGDIE